MAPFFSIILPVYNVDRYLQRCANSILSQTFSDYEMILVDDGSTDKSSAICDELAQKYPCIRVIHKENGGLASARNAGLEKACGAYIWWVDSDDWVSPDSLQKLYQAANESTADIIKFNYHRVEDGNCALMCTNVPAGMHHTLHSIETAAFWGAGKYQLSACTHIYKRKLLQQSGVTFVSERLVGSEDYLFNLQLLLHTKSVWVMEDALYYYEQRMGSLTQRYKPQLAQQYAALYTSLRQYYGIQGALERYAGKISAFYLWHLLHGTCLPNEYGVTPQHSLKQGRENVRKILKHPTLRQAYANCDRSHFAKKQRVQLLAMRLGIEPLFYWLYVIKPRNKKESGK